MIYLTGDFHGRTIVLEERLDDAGVKAGDTVIILGDAGLNYHLNSLDDYGKKMLYRDFKDVTFAIVHGNHEEYPSNIPSYSLTNYAGNLAYTQDKYTNLKFLIDGESYMFEDSGNKYRSLVIGGAYSVDKYYRLEKDMKWFISEEQLMFNKHKCESLISQLIMNQNTVYDLVLTHACPLRWVDKMSDAFIKGVDQSTVEHTTEDFLDKVETNCNYNHWYFGHYHLDREITDKATVLYRNIIKL